MSETPTEPIEVLLVVDDDVFRRLGKLPRLLCVGMVDEPVRVTVLTPSWHEGMDDALGPARLVGLPGRIWPWRQYTAEQLEDEFGITPPHIVHCLSPVLAEWALRWVHEWESELMVQLTDLLDVDRFCEMDLPEETVPVAISRSVESGLVERLPETRPRARTIPVGLPALAEPLCLAQPDRIPAVVVTVPLTRDCGLEPVLRATQAIVQGGQEVQLFILSTGPAERALRRLVEKLRIVPNVTFCGPMADWYALEDAMRGADFYMMPNIPPRYTTTRLAALANGLAVIAPVGSVEDYLIDGTTACMFDPQRPGQLTDRWIHLLETPAAARELALSAQNYVRKHHQASTMISAVTGLYRELCGWPTSAGSTSAVQ